MEATWGPGQAQGLCLGHGRDPSVLSALGLPRDRVSPRGSEQQLPAPSHPCVFRVQLTTTQELGDNFDHSAGMFSFSFTNPSTPGLPFIVPVLSQIVFKNIYILSGEHLSPPKPPHPTGVRHQFLRCCVSSR